MPRVFIAEDHPIMRQGLRQLIEGQPGMQVVGEAADGRQVLLAEGKESWDVLLLDLSLPRVSGLEVLRRLREEVPRLRVLVLSMYPEDQYGPRIVSEGAAGYISKEAPPEELMRALAVVARGGRYVSDAAKQSALSREGASDKPLHTNLSAREYQVFVLIFQGRTVTEIAAELDLSVSTVSNHVAKIKDKLAARSIAEIVTYAHRAGLVDPHKP